MNKLKQDISNKSQTQNIIRKHGFTFKKSLGQNFLIEPTILDKIVRSAGIDQDTGVIEIGPGIGALTQKLAEKAGKVVAIEIDQRLIPILGDTLSDYSNVKVIHGDVLKISVAEIIEQELATFKSIKVVANLPYYITSPIIIKLLEEKLSLDKITIMIQKEVAERISASPGGKEYGSLTVAIEYYAEAEISFTVPKTVFVPQPNVDSAILNLTIRKQPPYEVEDEERLFKVIRASFAQRRKTLYNNMINLVGKENKETLLAIFNKTGIEPSRRAETLSLLEFVELSNNLKNLSF